MLSVGIVKLLDSGAMVKLIRLAKVELLPRFETRTY